jgi:hypothetical protein
MMSAVPGEEQVRLAWQQATLDQLREFISLSPDQKLRLLMEVLDMCWEREARRSSQQPIDVLSKSVV